MQKQLRQKFEVLAIYRFCSQGVCSIHVKSALTSIVRYTMDMNTNIPENQQILNFWFKELSPEQWWKVDPKLDARIKQEFGDLHQQAVNGELWEWRKTAAGALAEIIILDQFSRNIYRNSPEAFRYDNQALILSQNAIDQQFNKQLSAAKLAFLYMPFMHSESKKIHEIAVKLFSEPGLENNLAYEYLHKAIIDQFGRYPHRNSILGRASTPKEIEFLKKPNSHF